VAGCCECGDEPSGSCPTELVITIIKSRRMRLEEYVPHGGNEKYIQNFCWKG
jgi:hypothetical protein